MTRIIVTNLTQLRDRLQRAKPGDIVEHQAGILRPRIPIVVPKGATLQQSAGSVIDERANK